MLAERKYKRLHSSEWAEIEAHWETGAATLEDLSHQFGVTTRAIQLHFEKRGIHKGSKADEMTTAVRSEVFSKSIGDFAKVTDMATEARERSFNNALAIEEMVMKQLVEAQRSPENAYKAAVAIKTLGLAAQALDRLHAIKWSALGLDRNEVLHNNIPEIVFRDLTEVEIEKLQADDKNRDE